MEITVKLDLANEASAKAVLAMVRELHPSLCFVVPAIPSTPVQLYNSAAGKSAPDPVTETAHHVDEAPVTVEPVKKPKKPAAVKPAPAPVEEEDEPTAQAPEPAPIKAAPAPAANTSGITLEFLRARLGEVLRANPDNRDKARAELNRLGAENVSTLDPSNYGDFYAFLQNFE